VDFVALHVALCRFGAVFWCCLRKDSGGRSPFWICCYTSAIGQRLQKSTKITVKPFKGEKCKDGSLKTAADKRTQAWKRALQSS
jgi:hypothetical protein